MMAIRDMGNDRLSISLAALGRYRFVAQPDARGTNNPAERISTILGNGIENSVLNNK